MIVDDKQAVLARISERLEALGLSERAAVLKAGLSASAIRNVREGKSRKPKLDTLGKLAPVLETSPEWLAYGTGTEIAAVSGVAESGDGLSVIGEVAAGRWLEADDHVDEPVFDRLPVQYDTRWPQEDQFGLVVRGTSLNRVAIDGDILVCVKASALLGAIREDELVIVEMRRNAGLFRQRTAKRYVPRDTHVELWPDSDDPRWQNPIIIPKIRGSLDSVFEDDDGRIDVSIYGLVNYVHRPIQRRRRPPIATPAAEQQTEPRAKGRLRAKAG